MEREEEIRASLELLDADVAKDALAIVLSKKSDFSANPAQSAAAGGASLANFAQAILWLKSRFKFKELDLFSVEADLVYVAAGDRRVLLTDERAAPAGGGQASFANAFGGYGGNGGGYDFENSFEPMRPQPKMAGGQNARPAEESAALQAEAFSAEAQAATENPGGNGSPPPENRPPTGTAMRFGNLEI